MKYGVYAIRDELTEFAPPEILTNDSVAIRYFRNAQLHTNTIKDFRTNFSIWKLGEYDTKSGIITALAVPELLERGVSDVNTIKDQETL